MRRNGVLGWLFAYLTILLIPQSIRAGFIDFVPGRPGVQSVGWAEPTTIMIFIPANLAGADRMNFEMGINSVVECLTKLMVQFKDGDPPPNSQDYIDVNIVPLGAPPYGSGGPFVPNPYPNSTNHYITHSGEIKIDPAALGHAANAGSFMKNLGAHEFGHVLGLDDDPRQGGERMNVMDPDFNLIFDQQGQVVGADPFVSLSASDRMMLEEHYTVCPEPGSLALCVTGTLSILAYVRRHRQTHR